MFLQNKYTKIYYRIINRSFERNHIKERNDGFQTHHIVPRCFGGSNSSDNRAVLTYKEHRVCHRLLIAMTSGANKHKMMYAYKLFNKHYDTSHLPAPQIYCTHESYIKMSKTRKSKGSYKRGKDNIFSTPELVEQVRQRMIENNPMKDDKQRERMSKTNWRNNACTINGVSYVSQSAARRALGITLYELRRDYLNLYSQPAAT